MLRDVGGDTSNISETFSFEASDGERTNTISASLSDSIILSDHQKNAFADYTDGFPALRVMNETPVYDPVKPMVLEIESSEAFLEPTVELYWNDRWVSMGTITSSTTHYSATYDASEKVRVSGAGSEFDG